MTENFAEDTCEPVFVPPPDGNRSTDGLEPHAELVDGRNHWEVTVDAPEDPVELMEARLATEFVSLVNDLSIAELIHPLPGRKIPKNLDDYRFIPLAGGTIINGSGTSEDRGDYWYTFPEDVTYNDRENLNRKPYMDTGFAIGLVYRDVLAALAGAHVNYEGLIIAQLQGANGDASDPKKKYRTGLHGGFYWRDTLVQAWISIAESLGAETIAIQGAENNRYITDGRRMALTRAYDMVAKRMGFAFQPGGDGNLRMKIPQKTPPKEQVAAQESGSAVGSVGRRLLGGLLGHQ